MMRNNLLFIGSGDGTLSILDLRFGGLISQETAHKRKIPCLIASKHSDMHFYTGSHDGNINKWDMRNGNFHTLGTQKYGVSSLSESADGKILFSGGADGIRAWDIEHHASLSLDIVKNLDTKTSFIDSLTTNSNGTEIYFSSPSGITTLALKK